MEFPFYPIDFRTSDGDKIRRISAIRHRRISATDSLLGDSIYLVCEIKAQNKSAFNTQYVAPSMVRYPEFDQHGDALRFKQALHNYRRENGTEVTRPNGKRVWLANQPPLLPEMPPADTNRAAA